MVKTIYPICIAASRKAELTTRFQYRKTSATVRCKGLRTHAVKNASVVVVVVGEEEDEIEEDKKQDFSISYYIQFQLLITGFCNKRIKIIV